MDEPTEMDADPLPVDGLNVHVMPTQYTVTCLPEDPVDGPTWDVNVEYRGQGRWVVNHRGIYTLNADGKWDLDPGAQKVDDGWLETHRFDRHTALGMAVKAAPDVKVNGLTPTGVLEWRRQLAENEGAS